MRICLIPALTLALCVLPAGASAEERAGTSQTAAISIQAGPVADPAGEAGASPFAVAAIGESELGAIAGREDTAQIARNEQYAGVANNSVGDNAVTGDARISDNAFQNMSGLSILNVNTGNNVAINASMNVNVSISPGP